MISLQNASRWYGPVIGLNDVTCSFESGITALLGQNGAGKSTLIKLVTGQLKPSTGQISVFGQSPFANVEVNKRVGYCPETDSFYEEMTGRQFVALMARMSGVSDNLFDRVDESIQQVGMTPRANSKIGGYSKGMRQRIKLAQAIVHDPDVIILDEPLNGLDPVGRREMSDLLRQLADMSKCIVISSHILHEVEQMTQNIVLLHRGRLMAVGDVREIRSLIDRHPHRIRIQMDGVRRLAQELMEMPSVLSLTFDRNREDHVEIETSSPDEFYSQVSSIVLKTGIEFKQFMSPDNNLEAVFSYLVKG